MDFFTDVLFHPADRRNLQFHTRYRRGDPRRDTDDKDVPLGQARARAGTASVVAHKSRYILMSHRARLREGIILHPRSFRPSGHGALQRDTLFRDRRVIRGRRQILHAETEDVELTVVQLSVRRRRLRSFRLARLRTLGEHKLRNVLRIHDGCCPRSHRDTGSRLLRRIHGRFLRHREKTRQ